MISRDAIERRIDAWLKWKFKDKAEILRFLLKHERKQLFVSNMTREILNAWIHTLNF